MIIKMAIKIKAPPIIVPGVTVSFNIKYARIPANTPSDNTITEALVAIICFNAML